MDKLKMHSADLTKRNVDRIAELFPTVITERLDDDGNPVCAIDFDLLRQELSDHIVEGPQERYQLDWPGKRAALFAANAPIAKTLRPVREESVNFDTTKNLFIEGDNLDALKLLQESYLGKIKLIYIDPPYNTGNDLIYEDDFAQSSHDYLAKSNQLSASGERLVANTESNGRFHSDWLSMMYPRLKMARNLLREDGAIFISIDDNEQANLRKLCNEIFGEQNFIAQIVWQKKQSPQNDATYMSAMHDYILVYAKQSKGSKSDPNGFTMKKLERTADQESRFKNPDNDPRGPWISIDMTSNKNASERPNLYYSITNPATGREVTPSRDTVWRYERTSMQSLIDDGRVWFGKADEGFPRQKRFRSEIDDGVTPSTWWTRDFAGDNQEGRRGIRKLFPDFDAFSTPKPVALLKRILELATDSQSGDIVMDFFSGSATTGHAVMEKNSEDGGNRRFILVQLPEPTGLHSEPRRAGFTTISEISRERLRRAAAHLAESASSSVGDLGFRSLAVDSTNMVDVLRAPDALDQQQLGLDASSVKPDRTGEDLLFGALLDWGLEVAIDVAVEHVEGREVFIVDGGALIACFDSAVDPSLVRNLAARRPLRVLFRDSGFATDVERINAQQVFAEMSPSTEVKVI
jgi:adenine-specific DNA-methyltransferase